MHAIVGVSKETDGKDHADNGLEARLKMLEVSSTVVSPGERCPIGLWFV